MQYWLVKSEPSVYSIDDLKRDKTTSWGGVRNFQARNFLRSMEPGDIVLFYHSVEPPVGVAGLAKVSKRAYPDPLQYDSRSEYFDPLSSQERPRWYAPEIRFVEKFTGVLTLEDLRKLRGLNKMILLKRGIRLSVQPVRESELEIILSAARTPAARKT